MRDNRNRSIFSNLLRPEYVFYGFVIVCLWKQGFLVQLLHCYQSEKRMVPTLDFSIRFVKKYRKPLSSDVLSGFSSGPKESDLNQDVNEATRHLLHNIISTFSTKLCTNVVSVNAKYLHSKRTPYTPFG